MNKLRKLNKQEQGYSLAGVLIIFIVATVLGMSIVALSVNSMSISNKEHDDQSAFYIAESGTNFSVSQVEELVESATEEMETYLTANPNFGVDPITGDINEVEISDKFFEFLNPKFTDPLLLDNVYDKFEEIKGYPPKAELSITEKSTIGDNPRKYTITSKGIIGDEDRIVELPIEIEWFAEPEYALLGRSDVTITGSGVNHDGSVKGVQGDIGTVEGKVKFDGGAGKHFEGNLFVEDSLDEGSVTGGGTVTPIIKPEDDLITIDESTQVPELPAFPSIPNNYPNHDHELVGMDDSSTQREIIMTSNRSYTTLSMRNGNVLTFDVGNDDYEIVVDRFDLTGPDIRLKGDGTLTIYVKNEFILKGGSIGEIDKVDQLNMFYQGSSEINLSLGGNSTVFGSIYAETANLNFAAGSGFYGNILSGGTEINLGGGAQGVSQLVLAPNASVNVSTGDFVGTIVSDKINVTGGTIKYEKINSTGPLSLEGVMNAPENAGNTFMQRMDPSIDKQSVREK